MSTKWLFYLALVLIGAAWGLTFPITKFVVSSGHQPYGILVWAMAIAILVTGLITLLRGKKLIMPRQYFGLFFGVAMLGSVLSGYFSYTAARHLSAGVLAIIIALVPLFSMPIALVMGFEKPSFIRLLGLLFGAAAVAVLIAPAASLPNPQSVVFVLIAMLATFAYEAEGNFLEWFARRRATEMPDPFQILFGASVVSLGIVLPLALLTDQFIDPRQSWGKPEIGIVLIAVLSTAAYSGYIWLIAQTGPIFAAQVSYLVTGFGVFWSMLLLNETYSGWVWLSLALIISGLFLVQPRPRDTSA